MSEPEGTNERWETGAPVTPREKAVLLADARRRRGLTLQERIHADSQRRWPEKAWKRTPDCVSRWPDCSDGGYNPACCRFPKECSCNVPVCGHYNACECPPVSAPLGEPPDDLLTALVKATAPIYYDGHHCLTCNQPEDGNGHLDDTAYGQDLELGHQDGCPWLAAAKATGWKGTGT